MRALRIAWIVDEHPAPTETFVAGPLRRLRDTGHRIDVFARHRRDTSNGTHDGVRDWSPPGSWARRLGVAVPAWLRWAGSDPRGALRGMDPVRFRDLAWSLELPLAAVQPWEEESYDVVHAHFGPPARVVAALHELGRVRGPLVASFYGWDVGSYLRRRGENAYRRLFERASLLLLPSDEMRHRLVDLGAPAERTRVHRLGVDLGGIPRRPDGPPDPGQRLRLLAVARLVEKKGLDDAVRAVDLLRGRDRDVALEIIGDGPLRASLEEQVSRSDLGEAVRFRGSLAHADALEALTRSDLLLAPSREAADGDVEGTPVVILEAMAAGVPVVASDHAGIPEVLDDGACGRLVRERDPEALAEAVLEVTTDGTRWRDLRAAALRKIEAHDEQRLAERLVELYRGL